MKIKSFGLCIHHNNDNDNPERLGAIVYPFYQQQDFIITSMRPYVQAYKISKQSNQIEGHSSHFYHKQYILQIFIRIVNLYG